MESNPPFCFSFLEASLPSFPPGPTFHPGTITLFKKPNTKKKPKYPADHVRVKKRYNKNIPVLKPKTSFEIKNPHMFFTAVNCPIMYRTWLQFMGQSITDRYIYFDNLRLAKANKHSMSFLKLHQMEIYRRYLLFWVKKEQNVRTQMRKLVAMWLRKRYESRMLNTEDPATLVEPNKPVLIFDSKARGSYVFEASTIKRQLEENLGYCKWFVSEPQAPKNPLTNLPFHTGQVAEIFRQLAIYGYSSWILEGFKDNHYNLGDFLEFFRQPLRMRTVDHCCKNPTCEDTQEFVEEFMEDEFEHHDIPYNSTLTILKWALNHKTDLKYVRSWITAWAEYYTNVIKYGEQTIRDNPRLIDFVHDMTDDLFRNRVMIQKLGRMRLEAITNKEEPEPIYPQQTLYTVSHYSSDFEETSQRITRQRTEDVEFTLGDDGPNVLVALHTISDGLIEALLRHAPPSD
jgi:hypothetical protein